MLRLVVLPQGTLDLIPIHPHPWSTAPQRKLRGRPLWDELKIYAGEPITFCEDTTMTAISLGNLFDSAMQAFALGTGATRQPENVVPAESEAEYSGNPMEDYVVELSEAARKLAESENPFEKALNGAGLSTSANEEEEEDTSLVSQLKERIRKLQQEISEIQNDTELTDEERQQQLMLKQSELAELQTQLAEALEAEQGGSQVGGSGFMNTGSLT